MDKKRHITTENVVIFYNWFNGINGALIDAFEYYISILEKVPVKFLLINRIDRKLDNILHMFENRYDLDDLKWKENIITTTLPKLIHLNFKNSLVVDYSTINKTKGLLRSEKIIVISDFHTDKKEFMYDKEKQNVIYYGEMPFVYNDVPYRMKFLFDRFKELRYVKDRIYINSPFNKDISFVNKLNLDKEVIFKSTSHLDNLFEQFNTYIYYHANKWFDPHPRLFHECYFYGKNIQYINDYGVLDGGYYRYVDLKKTGLNNRYLNENDEIVKEFL
jgi:hypothetical protein